MIQWLMAVLTASLLGSLHCVGMCGPFVLIATGSDGANAEGSKALPVFCYHAGRLTTYLLLGLLIGSIASASEGLAGRWQIGHAASIVVGVTLLGLGFIRLWRLFKPTRTGTFGHSKFFSLWHTSIATVRQRLRTRNRSTNAYVWGLLSTWLPCGWLYVFALASATAGSLVGSVMTMAAFWVGTLPSLSIVAWGGTLFRKVNPVAMQWIAAGLMIGFGLWTLTARASIDLSSLVPVGAHDESTKRGLGTELIRNLEQVELPCCQEELPAEAQATEATSGGSVRGDSAEVPTTATAVK